MPPQEHSDLGSAFPPTQWTVLLNPIRDRSPDADAALEKLCRSYWAPLYEFVRRRGNDHHTAEELTQDFIGTLLRRDGLARVRRENGRFRSFLLASLRNFLIKRHERASAQKRGGGEEPLPLDEQLEGGPIDPGKADLDFDRQWACEVIETALSQLERDHIAAGKQDWFADVKGFLTEGQPAVSRADLAAKHGLEINALDVAIHRLRKRYGAVLRELIAQTVTTPEEVDEEVRYLMSVIGR